MCYRSGTVNSKSFVSKDLLRIKWNFELTVHFKHEMIGKHFIESSNKVELRINRVRINRTRPVCVFVYLFTGGSNVTTADSFTLVDLGKRAFGLRLKSFLVLLVMSYLLLSVQQL